MESEKVAAIPADKKSSGKDRSTIEFPYADLDGSFEVVRGVHNAGGTTCEADQLAAQLNLEAKGGGFRLRINAARIFGLITYERGGRISLTEIGRQAIDPQYERSAKVKAFLTVPLFQRVYDEFKGRPLPPRAGLERTLVGFGVAEKVKDRARQVLDRSAKQAGFFDAATDRLVKPRIEEDTGGHGEEKQERKEEKHGGGDGGGGSQFHPFIEGLLKTLPQPGTKWTLDGRVKWLQAAAHMFDLIYEADQEGAEKEEIEVKKKKS